MFPADWKIDPSSCLPGTIKGVLEVASVGTAQQLTEAVAIICTLQDEVPDLAHVARATTLGCLPKDSS